MSFIRIKGVELWGVPFRDDTVIEALFVFLKSLEVAFIRVDLHSTWIEACGESRTVYQRPAEYYAEMDKYLPKLNQGWIDRCAEINRCSRKYGIAVIYMALERCILQNETWRPTFWMSQFCGNDVDLILKDASVLCTVAKVALLAGSTRKRNGMALLEIVNEPNRYIESFPHFQQYLSKIRAVADKHSASAETTNPVEMTEQYVSTIPVHAYHCFQSPETQIPTMIEQCRKYNRVLFASTDGAQMQYKEAPITELFDTLESAAGVQPDNTPILVARLPENLIKFTDDSDREMIRVLT